MENQNSQQFIAQKSSYQQFKKQVLKQIIKDQKELKKLDPSDLLPHKDIVEKKNEYCKIYKIDPKITRMFDLFIHRLMSYKVVNGVAPLSTGLIIDLNRIKQACEKNNIPFKTYNKFSGMSVKFVGPDLKFTGLFFKSGKINLIGLKGDTLDYLKKVVDLLKKYQMDMFGVPVFDQCTKRVANRVYSLKIPAIVDLSKIYLFNQLTSWKNVKYNSEAFPGAVIRFKNFRSKALCFRTGSVIITGIVSTNCKRQVLLQLIKILCEYLALKKTSEEYTNA